MEIENIQSFLNDLKEISNKHNIIINGCGCCDSPYLQDLKDNYNYSVTYDRKYKTAGGLKTNRINISTDTKEYISINSNNLLISFNKKLQENFNDRVLFIPEHKSIVVNGISETIIQKFSDTGNTLEEALTNLYNRLELYFKSFNNKAYENDYLTLVIRDSVYLEEYSIKNNYIVTIRLGAILINDINYIKNSYLATTYSAEINNSDLVNKG